MALISQSAETHDPPGRPVAMEVSGVSFAYSRDGHRLREVSLLVREAQICALLGANGAGKTTLLRCLLGLLRPHRGTIRILGRDIRDLSARDRARLVAYVPQSSSSTFPFTTLEVAVMGRTPHVGTIAAPTASDRSMAMDELERLGIDHLADRPFSLLSGGERQLALIARALVQQSPVLVLDEPTAALDYGNEVRTLQVVAELARAGRCVIMTTHQPAHALAYASQVVLMRDGLVVADGHPDSVLTSQTLSDLYDVPIHVVGVSVPGRPGHEQRVSIADSRASRSGWPSCS